MDLFHTLLETCTTLKRRVEHLEQDKIAQSLEITKLKQRVKKLERRNKLKVSKLRILKRVGTAHRVDTSNDTVMDDVSKKGRIIASMDADVVVTLKDVADIAKEVVVDAEIEESADVLSMHDDKLEPTELQEVVEVVTTAKLVTEVVTAASATITAADTPIPAATIIAAAPTLTIAPSAARRRKGVLIRDPEETATPSIIIHLEPKSKDKGKGNLVEEPKPLKKQAQIEQDEAYARELEAELNKNINWDDVIDQVQRKEKEDNAMMRYQALKRKPQTEAQSRKNMMINLRNMVGFKMDYFKGMKYDDIRPIFEKYFNSNVAFLEKTKEQMEEEDSRALKRANESQAKKAAKREDLEVLWKLVKERFASSKPKNFSDDFLLTTLTYMFEKPDVQAQMILLVERRYLLTRFTLDQMLNNVRLEVEEESEVSLELLRFVRQQQQEGFTPE
uniref:Uncharacterized protein n=1 Tax=Tanacetum cinerariifolium TaxID=118510 RepID=A0A6L2M9Q4_TANCI|nr:hypothetical protein [Tanacetum cinerariifolium]